MSLQFILGNSGSGKSHYLYEKIVNDSITSPDTQYLVIVPDQFTMQTQQDLVSMHPRKGLLNIDILSFERLAHRIFEELGEDRRTILEDTGKTLLLRRVVRKNKDKLKVLQGSLQKPGCLAELKSMISELTQYDIDCDRMDALLEAAKGKPRLSYKLQDIQLLYEAFLEELEDKYITAEERLEVLCDIIDRSALLKNSVLAFDGFTGFTPLQVKTLQHLLALAGEVYVTVTIDTRMKIAGPVREHELFCLSKKTIRMLQELARETGCELLEPVMLGQKSCPRFAQAPQLGFMERHLFRNAGREVYRPQEESVSLHTAATPIEEVSFAARTIRKLVQEGNRYQDIAVIVGDLPSYSSYIPRIFASYDVPVFMDNRRSLLMNPLVEFIRAAFELVQENFSRTAVFRLLRTGLCNIEDRQIDLLENYVLAAGIRGSRMWQTPFTRETTLSREEQDTCEELRAHLISCLAPFTEAVKDKAGTVREKTIAIYQLMEAFGVQEQVERYRAQFAEQGRAELEKEYAQSVDLVIGLFEKLVELLGTEAMELREYTELLEAGFAELKVGVIPPVADCVPVGDLTRTRLKDIRYLIFLGMNDGWVPSAGKSGGLLSDMDREILADCGVELAPTARQDSYVQQFYIYMVLTRPSRHLFLSCCKAGMDGTAMRASFVMRSMMRLFPQMRMNDESKKDAAVEPMTAGSGLEYLVNGLWEIRRADSKDAAMNGWLQLYNTYRQEESYRARVEELVRAAFMTSAENGIGKTAARSLYGEILVNSVSRLEKFASCAFAHFLQYGLQLKEREEYVFKQADTGTVMHAIIEHLSNQVKEGAYDWKTLPDEVRETYVEQAVTAVTAGYGSEILHSSARYEYEITRLMRIAKRTAWALQKQIAAGHFYPADFEVAFSQVSDLSAVNIALDEGEKMRLRGRIDRIDLCEQDDQVYVKVIDYKTGNKSFDLVALYHGLQLQLVVYLDAAMELEKKIHPQKHIVPAGILYYHISDPMLDGESPVSAEEINRKILRDLRPTGIVNSDPNVFLEMDSALAGTSDVIPVTLKKDGQPSAASRIVSEEQFMQLTDYVHDKIRELGSRIMSGETAAVPYERGQKTGCDYCAFHAVCGWDTKIPGTKRHRLQEADSDELWNRISGGEQ